MSIATVSMVINGKADGRVAPATQERVWLAVKKMGYRVDSTARSLVTGRRQCIALVAPDLSNPFFTQVAAGVAKALGDEYRLLLAVSGTERAEPDLDQLVSFGVDGILLEFPGTDVDVARLGCPVVMLDEPVGPAELSRVYFDTAPGAHAMVDRIVELGHRRLVYLDATPEGQSFAVRRRQVFERCHATDGTSVTWVRADITVEAARSLVTDSWSAWRDAGVTAVIAAADVLAYGVLSAFTELGVSIPGQVSVGSFDDLPFSEITSPPLTTVRLPAFELGHTSARMLRDLIDDERQLPWVEALGTSLTHRGSIGPARVG